MAKSKAEAMKIIAQHPCADMVTVDGNGYPADRAMWTAKVDEDFNIYFGTSRASKKCEQISAHPRVVLIWPTGDGFMTLNGSAELVSKQETLDYIWSDSFKTYFPGGSTDPDLIAIRVSPIAVTSYEESSMNTETVEIA